jgi:hypothetical protein
MEALRGKSVNVIKMEVREIVCEVWNWIKAVQDKLLQPH